MTPELDLVGLVVADLPASLRFYRDLGLPVPEPSDDVDHVEVTCANGLRLAWDSEQLVRSFDPDFRAEGRSRPGLAFRLPDAAAVDATAERMASAGHRVHRAPWDAFWGQRYAQLLDPDGVNVDLFADLDRPDQLPPGSV